MTFATLPLWAVLAGVPVLAGVLYLLQMLRSERRVVAFAAARLWEQVVLDPLLRERGRRFRYRIAYALSLAIVLLMWLAIAGPTLDGGTSGHGFRLFYLDNSALLTGKGDLAAAKRALLADVRAVAPSQRAVFLGDVTGTRLLAPGESSSLLAARLDDVNAAVQPSTVDDWIAGQASRAMAGTSPDITYYGAWGSVRQAAARGVHLRFGYLAPPVPGNRGIVALGVSPAVSGRWSKADVIVSLAGPAAWRPAASDLRVTRGGRDLDATGIVAETGGRFVLRDVDADGGRLDVALRRGDAFGADDAAAIRLPDRTPIHLALSPRTPAAIREVVGRDDAFVAVAPGAADVVVRRAGEAFGGNLPALELTDATAASPTFLFSGPGEDQAGLARRLGDYGLAEIDAAALADRLHLPISVDVADAPTRSVRAWMPLFDAGSSFANTAGMPLFVSRSLRWLAGETGWTPYAKANAPLPDQPALTGWSATMPGMRRALGGQVYAGAAGRLDLGAGKLEVALTDRGTTMAAAVAPPNATGGAAGTWPLFPPDLWFVVLTLLASLLLAGEWIAYQRGRLP